jgi:hypothetical protein
MRSLSAHLRQPGDHGRLPFHPDCPVCRSERLVGALASGGVTSRRANALLASSVLALSTSGPGAAIAAEPEHEQQGTAAPGQAPSGDPATSPDFDPGGQSTSLPAAASPAPQVQAPPTPGNDDAGPLDQEPQSDNDAPVVDAGDGSTTPGQPQPTAPTATTPPAAPTAAAQPASTVDAQPAAAPAGPPATADTATADASPPPAAAPTAPDPPTTGPARATARREASNQGARRHHASRTPQVTRPVAAHPTAGGSGPSAQGSATVAATAAPPRTTIEVADVAGPKAKPGDRTHAVRPGESLWSIASDLLGTDASPAAVAREVHHLWQLNTQRIGTGDPDLLMIGTRLNLR